MVSARGIEPLSIIKRIKLVLLIDKSFKNAPFPLEYLSKV